MKFTDEMKEEPENNGGTYFDFGVHKVQIGIVEKGESPNTGSEYLEFTVVDPEDAERTDTARVYFTDKSAQYSINTCRQIAVHNAKEEAKDKARDAVDACDDVDELLEVMQKTMGGECWFTKYVDRSRTYEGKDGSTRYSTNKNIYGWEPKLNQDRMPKDGDDPDSAPKDFPIDGAKKATGDAAANIPKDDDWAK